MLSQVISVLFAIFVGAIGVALGWWLRGGQSKRSGETGDSSDTQHAQEALAYLHELAASVAADVGEHNSRVQEISDGLSENQDAASVVSAVSQLINANEQMQQQLASAEQKLEEQAAQIEARTAEALTDELTQLPNRRAFDMEMARRHAEFERHGRPACVMLIDVDHFKKFNDTHGHQAGDEVLRGVGRVLKKTVRAMDVPARYGGEEFTVVFPATSVDEVKPVADRIRAAIEKACFHFEGVDLRVTASGGVAQLRAGEDFEATVKRADDALYVSKEAGRNCVHWHDGKTSHLIDKNAEPQPKPEVPKPGPVAKPPKAEEKKPSSNAGNRISDMEAFHEDLKRRLAERTRTGTPLSVILVAIDDHAGIVARLGGEAGDMALRAVSQFLRAAMRDMDHVSRYGGQSFALLLPSAALNDATQVGERLRNAIARCVLPVHNERLTFTVSLGVAEAIDSEDAPHLLSRVEQAMDDAGSDGANRAYVHDGRQCQPATTQVPGAAVS